MPLPCRRDHHMTEVRCTAEKDSASGPVPSYDLIGPREKSHSYAAKARRAQAMGSAPSLTRLATSAAPSQMSTPKRFSQQTKVQPFHPSPPLPP
eukprot:398431-Pleurochrysis_carterae.AAC.2